VKPDSVEAGRAGLSFGERVIVHPTPSNVLQPGYIKAIATVRAWEMTEQGAFGRSGKLRCARGRPLVEPECRGRPARNCA